jgi:hypothetical protein
MLGAVTGVLLARRRSTRLTPSPGSQVPAGVHPEYDPEVELELELIRAERDAAGDGPPATPEQANRA